MPLKTYSKNKIAVQLSDALIEFGKCSLFSKNIKTFFLYNEQDSEPIIWKIKSKNADKLKVSPSHGRLNTNEYATLSIVYNALPPESIFYEDLTFEIKPVKETEDYRKSLATFKEMKHREQFEFEITDEKVEPKVRTKSGMVQKSPKVRLNGY